MSIKENYGYENYEHGTVIFCVIYLNCDWLRIGHLEFDKINVRLLRIINHDNGRTLHGHLIVCHFRVILFKRHIKFEWLVRVGLYGLIPLDIFTNEFVFSASVEARDKDRVEVDHNIFCAHILHFNIKTKMFAIFRILRIERNVWIIYSWADKLSLTNFDDFALFLNI